MLTGVCILIRKLKLIINLFVFVMVEEMFRCLLVKGVDSVVMSIPLSTCWMNNAYYAHHLDSDSWY